MDRIKNTIRVFGLLVYMLFAVIQYSFTQNTSRPIVNQAGYNLNEAKRFVCYGVNDGEKFDIVLAKDSVNKKGEVLFTSKVKNYAGDFTNFNPVSCDEYVVKIQGYGYSYPFWIADHLMEGLSSQLAYQFFIDVRGSENPVFSDEANVAGGGPSRDCGAYALETPFEIMLYASNPALFDRWHSDFKDTNTPDLIKLILWHAKFAYHHRDYNGSTGHRPYFVGHPKEAFQTYDYQNTLDHLAAACAAYHSFLKPWMSEEEYEHYRNVCLQKWEEYERDKEVRYYVKSNKWVDKGWQEFSEMGNVFGQAILRNLFMYLCEKNEKNGQPEKFLTYAQQAARDVIKNWDFNNPRHMWWIRNGEHITPQALAFFLMVAPDEVPFGTREKLEAWTEHLKNKTNNFWHYRKHSDSEWAHPKTKELGNSGMGGSMFIVAHVLKDIELRKLAWSQVNQVFGMNPAEAHYSHKEPARLANNGYWKGIEVGWPVPDPNGAGRLKAVRGTIDGTPLNSAFPYNKKQGHENVDFPETQYWYATEGWAISNRAWMSTVIFSSLDALELKILDVNGNKLNQPKKGDIVTIELKAALNLDWEKREKAWVNLSVNKQFQKQIELKETLPNSSVFRTTLKLDHQEKTKIKISYGYLGFDKIVEFEL